MSRRMAREPQIAAPETATTVETTPAAEAAPKTSKIASLLSLLRCEEGATLAELTEETRWLPHTKRAALTGLKKKGHTVDKTKREDVTCYRVVETA